MAASSSLSKLLKISAVIGPSVYICYRFVRWTLELYYMSSKGHAFGGVNETLTVLFFPDNEVACRAHFTQRYGCTSQRCRFSHNPRTSYAQLLQVLNSAGRSIDMCVYTITCSELADVIVDLHKQGVKVRVITDKEMIDSSGSQVGRFRMAGIQVRYRASTFLMHHKFTILDGQRLVNGSFNWTRQAITGNNENLVISCNHELLKTFETEFERLWAMFDPVITLQGTTKTIS